jgi:hypothetical protein
MPPEDQVTADASRAPAFVTATIAQGATRALLALHNQKKLKTDVRFLPQISIPIVGASISLAVVRSSAWKRAAPPGSAGKSVCRSFLSPFLLASSFLPTILL